ncbi:MAG: TetR/AcrR family transcriptional regulator [Pseudomonadota bacterium]
MTSSASQRKPRPGVAQQRQAILGAAVRVFGSQGTAGASVSAICRQARLSRDTFYRCFDNKDQLIEALYADSVSANMLAVTAAVDADFTNPDWLHDTVDSTVDAILKQHEVARFLFQEAADPDSYAHEVIESAFESVAASMQRWCAEHYGRTPSRACFTGLLSAAQWLVHGAITSGMRAKAVAEAKLAIEELFLATFTGLSQS